MMFNSNEKSWGISINQRVWPKVTDYPTWANSSQQQKWGERGVILWCEESQTITRLKGRHALALLEKLQVSCEWQEQGCIVGEPAWRLSLDSPDGKGEPVLINQLALDPDQTNGLLNFLTENKLILKEMAVQEENNEKQALARVYDILFELAERDKHTIYDAALSWYENKRIMRKHLESGKWPETLTTTEKKLFGEVLDELNEEARQEELKRQQRVIQIKKNLLSHRFFWDRITSLWLQLQANERLYILQLLQDVEWDNHTIVEIRQIIENAQFFEAVSRKSNINQEAQQMSGEELDLLLDLPDDELWQTLSNLYRQQPTTTE